MTVRETINRIAGSITPLYGPGEAQAIARMVVADGEGLSFSQLIARSGEPCTVGNLDGKIAELAAGRPVQYVLGHCEFCGLDFEVGEGVLIPRPETEELVAAITKRAAAGASVLDLCTGSGCIAVALARQIPESRVSAADISPQALKYARRNAEKAGTAVIFFEADVLKELDIFADGEFDVIVSNPPYIPLSEMPEMHRNVTDYEPHEALFVDSGRPLLFYEAVAGHARRLLRNSGLLCFEVHERFADEVAGTVTELGFRSAEIIEDANLKPRIVCCRK